MTYAPEIEPLMPSQAAIARSALPDMASDLERKAAALAAEVSPTAAGALEAHMRVINAHYSSLIEGKAAQPADIRRALAGDYSEDPAERDLQLESVALVRVQEIVGDGSEFANIASPEVLRHLHRLFFELVPRSSRIVRSGEGRQVREVQPGRFRQPGEEVCIGQHLAPAPEDLDRLLRRFQAAYDPARFQGLQGLVAAMAAHHRLSWIHPFLDGNGRIARLHTDLFLRRLGVGARGLWSLSRGLARQHQQYKAALARADYPRQGSSDGRGALSEGGLVDFCEFMLSTAISEVECTREALAAGDMPA
jgi:Fic family protein